MTVEFLCIFTMVHNMRGPARMFADETILGKALRDGSVEQSANAAMAMSDRHRGYGFPIGGVVATGVPEGVISPGGVGYDINCGVRLVRTSLLAEERERTAPEIACGISLPILSGRVGSGGRDAAEGVSNR